jgi:hypothetical protein
VGFHGNSSLGSHESGLYPLDRLPVEG